MKPQFTAQHEAYIKGVATPEGEPFEWTVNWPSLQKMLPSNPTRTLDFGCSGGYLLPYLPGNVKEGCDSDADALAIAHKVLPDYSYYLWDGLSSCPAGHYDLIFAKLALHLIADYDVAVANLVQALSLGGRVVISYPHPMRTLQYGFGTYDAVHTYKVRLSYVDLEVTAVHRPLNAIIKPFLAQGLVLTAFDEVWRPPHLVIKTEDTLAPNRINLAFDKPA